MTLPRSSRAWCNAASSVIGARCHVIERTISPYVYNFYNWTVCGIDQIGPSRGAERENKKKRPGNLLGAYVDYH